MMHFGRLTGFRGPVIETVSGSSGPSATASPLADLVVSDRLENGSSLPADTGLSIQTLGTALPPGNPESSTASERES